MLTPIARKTQLSGNGLDSTFFGGWGNDRPHVHHDPTGMLSSRLAQEVATISNVVTGVAHNRHIPYSSVRPVGNLLDLSILDVWNFLPTTPTTLSTCLPQKIRWFHQRGCSVA